MNNGNKMIRLHFSILSCIGAYIFQARCGLRAITIRSWSLAGLGLDAGFVPRRSRVRGSHATLRRVSGPSRTDSPAVARHGRGYEVCRTGAGCMLAQAAGDTLAPLEMRGPPDRGLVRSGCRGSRRSATVFGGEVDGGGVECPAEGAHRERRAIQHSNL